MNNRLRDAYYQYVSERVRAGIVDHSLDIAILEGKTVEEHMVEVLRAAGKLPDDGAPEVKRQGMRGDVSWLATESRDVITHTSEFVQSASPRRFTIRRRVYTTGIRPGGYQGAILVGATG